MTTTTKPDSMQSTFHDCFDRTMNIAQRMHLIMTQADYLQKEDKEGMKYKIVSHDKVTGLLRPLCVAAGVIYFPLGGSLVVNRDGNLTEASFIVRFSSIDNLDDFIDVATFGYGVDTQDKGPGKALSYGVKYALLKAFGLETGDDPDLEQGDKANRRSSLQQRADGLRGQFEKAANDSEFREIMMSASTGEIFAALREREPAEVKSLESVMKSQAARVMFDLKAFKAEKDAASA